MPNTIRHKRNNSTGVKPSTTDLVLGELGINTYDGRVFSKKNDGSDAIFEVTPNGVLSTSLDNDYPTTRPTLDLNFAQTKRLDPRVTFSRSSSGTYFDANGVLQSAATNVARFDHNPSTGESLGLLVEEARTNSWTYSDRFDDAAWTKTNVVATPNTLLAPDGNFTAELLSSQAAGAASVNRTFTRNNPAFSVFIKAGSSSTANIKIQSDVVSRNVSYNVNLSTGVLTAGTGNTGNLTGWTEYTSITGVGNGWYRIFIGFVSSTTTVNSTYSISPSSNGSAAAANESVYIWGSQLELGSFPTSYIPTPATFTSRASSATYYDANGVIQTASTNVARSAAYFPDSNGVMRPAGLLLEAAGTNLLLRSQEIDNTTAWAGSYKLNYSANATTAPDGTTTADKVIPNTENVSHSTTQDPAGTISGTYTFSLYAKASGYNKIVLFIDGASAGGLFGSGSAVFDLSTKVITNINGSAAIETLPNGWYRCSVTGTSGSAVTVSTGFSIYDNSGNSTFAGNGTDGVFIWGAQLEASPYPTSYIATAGSTVTRSADVSSSATVTRSADVAQITGTNFSSWFNQTSGTLYTETSATSYGQALWRFQNSTRWYAVGSTANFYSELYDFAAGGAGATAANGQPSSSKFKMAATVDNTSLIHKACMNGGVVTPSSYDYQYNHIQLTIGFIADFPLYMNSRLSRLTYWPTRLSDATLQAITR